MTQIFADFCTGELLLLVMHGVLQSSLPWSRRQEVLISQAFDYEMTNINISINDKTTVTSPDGKVQSEEYSSAFTWHFDSYPFVCVVMLSDCSGMRGGETAI